MSRDTAFFAELGVSQDDRLMAEHACARVVVNAVRCVDARDYDAFAANFAPEGVLQRPGGSPLVGREAIAAAYKARPAGRLTRHLVSNTLIDVLSATSATGLSSVVLWSSDESAELTAQGRKAHAKQILGTFEDKFVCEKGRWYIAERAARFDMYVETN